jgi:rod shape-determining protein MreD
MTAVRRIIGIPATLLIALLVQVVLVNRAPLPGDAGPDLVLLTITALGVMLGPMTGLVAGFFAGLALDITPPAGHLAGEYALVFCLAGYACGRMRDFADLMEGNATLASVTIMAIGAAGGEAARAALGLMLSDPDVTGPAVKHVLPGAILYDLLLSPLVLWLTALAVGRPARANAPDPHRVPPRTASQYGAVRLATAGSAPRLHLGGASTAIAPKSPARREPRLRLAGSTSPALSRTGGGGSPSSRSLGGRRPISVNFSSSSSRDGFIGNGFLGGGMPGGSLGPSLFSGSPLRRASGPGKGWLQAGKSGGATGPGRARVGMGPGKGWLRSSSGPGASALRAVPDWRRNSPGKGWLRPSKPAKAPHVNSPGKGWLRPSKPAKAPHVNSPGKGWLRPSKPAKAPHVNSPGKGWLRPSKPAKAPRRHSPGKGWLNGSGVLGKPTTYQSRSVSSRRRRRIRLGGRR